MAALSWDGQRYRPIASEGGHADFAPNSELEIELLRYLNQKFGGHLSYEPALSRPGPFNIYTFLRDSKFAPEPSWFAQDIAKGEPTTPVSTAALPKTDRSNVQLWLFGNSSF